MSGGHYVTERGDRYQWLAWIARDGQKTVETGMADDVTAAHTQAEAALERLLRGVRSGQ